ncbi:MAG: ubiquinone-dependent pyruvate dehydrogenase [Chitinophagaceae bacterium]|nr:MAG: ubiquinone-dependent pyruvate dehydrogenase [Chitinophagaceae bacterium]
MAINVAEQLVNMLADAGIKRIYAVTGDSLNPVNDAIRRDKRIQWIHVRHEEAGAYAAGAEAQLTGNITCCAGSSGPGHVHLVNGLYDAHRSGAPVLAIASTCINSEFGMNYFQETNPIKLFDDCSLYNQVANTPEQLPRMLQAAMQHAIQLLGVSVVGLPGNVASAAATESHSSLKSYRTQPVIRPSEEEISALAGLLNKEANIVLFCGYGCRGAHEEIVALAQKLKAPVAYSFRGKMEVEYDNPYAVGMTGLLGMTSGYEAMHDADVLLLLGTDFPYTPFMPSDNKIIQIDIKAEHLGRRAHLTMGLQGNIKDTLKALSPLINEKKEEKFLKTQKAIYKKALDHLYENVKSHRGNVNAIHPEYVASVIDKLAEDDAIFCLDTGMCCVWGARYIQATKGRDILGSFVHGSMANAMPQAIGASFACPDRQVVALCGDGGLSMLLGDLMTIAQYKLPVKIIIFNNRSLGMVKLEMEVAGIPDWQTDMIDPVFEKIAEAMGIKGIKISSPEETEPLLKEVFETSGPVVANVMTDPNALALPPHIEWEQMKGFTMSMTKLMLGGRMQEVIDTVKSNINHLDDLL